jgi:hypothetical protein
MALSHHPHRYETTAREASYVDEGDVYDERRTTRTADGYNAAVRTVAALAGGVATVIGVVALIRIDWNDGLSSFPTDVAGMAFTPVVAIVTVLLGLVALAAGAAADRTSKLVVGALLACLGLGILIAGDSRSSIDVEAGHGWLALIVGAVLIAAGLMLRNVWESRRSVRAGGFRA